jgi:PDZ domain
MDPGSVAERIGLASGDRLLAYDGEPIKSREQLIAIVTHPEPGVHKLAVRHGDTITTREVPAGRLGVILVNVRAETKPEAPPSIGSTQRKRSQQRPQSNHYAR